MKNPEYPIHPSYTSETLERAALLLEGWAETEPRLDRAVYYAARAEFYRAEIARRTLANAGA